MIPLPPAPLVQCYWVLPGRFLAGEYPAHMDRPQPEQRLDALLKAGIDAFFDLTERGELEPYYPVLEERAALRRSEVHYRRFAIPDYGLPSRDQMRALLDAIDSSLEGGRNLYLHCWGGVGRTGMAVGCYLVRRGHSGDSALGQILAWRQSLAVFMYYPRSPETEEQAGFVRNWSETAGAGSA